MGRPQTDRQHSRLTVSLDEDAYKQVCDIATRNDVSAAWVIRRAVKEFLEKEKPEIAVGHDAEEQRQSAS
ncbi:ribbon-helix-helix protein, CopG family [Roseibium aggregatum]|uniref:ribbon-helix-helix protein, CopG family n=1 Tax=Roseibium aggregatum TaxID=187304 RepID=UPI0009D723B4|nr:ribbon-helix-helix protein, CopG family [Roseibium aggregatum]